MDENRVGSSAGTVNHRRARDDGCAEGARSWILVALISREIAKPRRGREPGWKQCRDRKSSTDQGRGVDSLCGLDRVAKQRRGRLLQRVSSAADRKQRDGKASLDRESLRQPDRERPAEDDFVNRPHQQR